MGLKLRANLFLDVDAPDVFTALCTFYGRRGARVIPDADPCRSYDLLQRTGRWCVLVWNGGWEWQERRAAQLFVAQTLRCPGLLVFVYDGQFWGYELFTDKVEDHFVQDPERAPDWFPDTDCRGTPDLLSAVVSWRHPEELAGYLVEHPRDSSRGQPEWRALNVPVRPGDRFRRFEECAVVDFLRALDVPVDLHDGDVRFEDHSWKTFRVDYEQAP